MKSTLRMTAAAALLSAATLVSGSALADGPAKELTKVPGGHYVIDKSHAKIIFSTTHFGFSVYYGLFTDFDASLDVAAGALDKSKIDVTVNLNGLETTDPKLNKHLKSADFFDVEQFPTATFKAVQITTTGPSTGKVTGDLTLHGVTKPVTLDATLIGTGVNPMSKAVVAGFSASGVIHRSEFGIKTYVPAVGDDVTLTISGEFDLAQ